MNKGVQKFVPVIILFGILAVSIFVSASWLVKSGFDYPVLMWGNIFLFVLSLVSFVLIQKAVSAASSQVFVRYFYISFIMKFFLVAITALLYGRLASSINRESIMVCMGLYIVYTFVEMRILLKGAKK